MADNKELPVIEVTAKDGNIYRVFADGSVQGFGEDPMVISRMAIRTCEKTDRPNKVKIGRGKLKP